MNSSRGVVIGLLLIGCLAQAAPGFAQEAASVPPIDAEEIEELEEATAPADAEIPDAVPPDDSEIPDAVAPAKAAESGDDAAPERDPTAMDPAPADASLLPVYKDFGELAGLTALMDDFMVLLLADPRTKPFFENSDQRTVKRHLVEQFCVILGGPCTYSGRDMKTVHAGFGITRGNFNALVEDLQIAMAKRDIPFRSQNKLLAKLAPMHRDIEEN